MGTLLDQEGFVVDSKAWTEELAQKIASDQFNISLGDTQWRCIRFVREYYQKWGSMPMVKTIRDQAELSVEEFDRLFRHEPSSARGVLCKISGLPRLLCIAAGC